VKASEILGMSYRQVKRSWARYQASDTARHPWRLFRFRFGLAPLVLRSAARLSSSMNP